MDYSNLVFEATAWREVFDEATGTKKLKAICESDESCCLTVRIVPGSEPPQYEYECKNMGCDGDCQLVEVEEGDGDRLCYCECIGADGVASLLAAPARSANSTKQPEKGSAKAKKPKKGKHRA